MEVNLAMSEGTDVYGSDGKHAGRVEAVGARYVTLAAGSLGQNEFHLPLAFIARADGERVDFTFPLVDAQAYRGLPPPEEPIYQEARPISAEERGTVGMPVVKRKEFGLAIQRTERA